MVNTSRRLFNLSNAITTIIKPGSDINDDDATELKGYIDDASDLKGEALIDTSDALTSLKEAENGVTKTESRSYVNTGYNIIPSTTKQSIKIPLPVDISTSYISS